MNQEYIDFFFTQPESEDCLFINVFAPAAAKHGPPLRPVLVHIPGGGWQVESATSDLSGIAAYDGVVGVTFNYRTNGE